MENDSKERAIIEDKSENEKNEDNIFSSESKDQKFKNNQDYKNWENSMFKKYGNDAKLFHCHEDNIFFYVSNKECMDYPYYSAKCPKCNYYVCYFCPFRDDNEKTGYGMCCFKRRLYYSFHQDSQVFIAPIGHWENYGRKLNDILIFFLFPFINSVYIIACISALLYYKMILKDYRCSEDYEDRLNKNKYIFEIFFVINSLFAIVLSISYIIINFYFLLFMWIISLPFKLIPIKFWAGILERGLAG